MPQLKYPIISQSGYYPRPVLNSFKVRKFHTHTLVALQQTLDLLVLLHILPYLLVAVHALHRDHPVHELYVLSLDALALLFLEGTAIVATVATRLHVDGVALPSPYLLQSSVHSLVCFLDLCLLPILKSIILVDPFLRSAVEVLDGLVAP